MKRGEIWTVAAGNGYVGKARPAVVIQDDAFDATASIIVCAFTTESVEAPLFRLPVKPNAENGLRIPCHLMVDKIASVPKSRLGRRVGRLGDDDLVRLNRAALVFLGLATT
ncbi:MAG TPA: type II toxin-antitoxin system PemK/MazF family toxin, partial [Rhodanobacteraceae bacterium]|nr:type II toxin-antitoxin system PemK/MazF family toxin [Rhodanobacteraceae bacterium]